MKRFVLLLIVGALFAAGAAAQVSGFTQRGRATQEMKTGGLAIAHPSLPLNSNATVTNAGTGRQVEAAVSGRIQPSAARIADVSEAVWQALELNADSEIIISVAPPAWERSSQSTAANAAAANVAVTPTVESAATGSPSQPVNVTVHIYMPPQQQEENPASLENSSDLDRDLYTALMMELRDYIHAKEAREAQEARETPSAAGMNIAPMNVLIEIFGILTSAVVLILLATGTDRKSRSSRLFMRIVICHIAALSSALLSGITANSLGGIIVARTAVFLNYGLSYLLIPLSTAYIVELIGINGKTAKIIVRAVYFLWCVAVALVLVSQFNSMYYSFDHNNMYEARELFWLSQAFGILPLLINTAVVVRNRKIMGHSNTVFLLSGISLPITAMIVQTAFLNELEFIFIAATLSIISGYGGVQARLAKPR